MRLEIIIPDSTNPGVKARLAELTKRLSAQPELVDEIELDDDAAIQRMFTPERLAHIDQALEEVNAGRYMTAKQVDRHFAEKEASWMKSKNP